MSVLIFTIIGWLFSHTAAAQCSNMGAYETYGRLKLVWKKCIMIFFDSDARFSVLSK